MCFRFKQKFITYVSHDIQEIILPVAPFYPDINGGVIQIVTHSVCKQTFEWYCIITVRQNNDENIHKYDGQIESKGGIGNCLYDSAVRADTI